MDFAKIENPKSGLWDYKRIKDELFGFMESTVNPKKNTKLANCWNTFKHIAEVPPQNQRKISKSEGTLCVSLFWAVNYFKNRKNFDRMMQGLLNDSDFDSTVYEFYVGMCYERMGYGVEIVDERPNDEIKTCDFLIKTDRGNPVYVECKSIKNIIAEDQHIYDLLTDKIIKELDKKNLRIEIKPKNRIKIIEINSIFTDTMSLIEKMNTQHANHDSQRWRIEVSKEPEKLGVEKLPFTMPDLEHDINSGKLTAVFRIDENGVPNFKKSNEIQINQSLNIDISKQIVSYIQNARKKVPDGYPCILHINGGTNLRKRLYYFLGENSRIAFKSLNNNTSKINALCISYINFENPLHFIIPNYRYSNPFPPDFRMFSTNNLGAEDKLPDKGSISLTCDFNKDGLVSFPFQLLWYSSDDGQYQINIIKYKKDSYSVEIYSPDFGQLQDDFLIKGIELPDIKKIKIAWDSKVDPPCILGLMINGTLIKKE
ncbi:hypothetical protein [uncultured Desulfobacter sp.]|uniref:hypothetical protein n=1 Tax=uncultured Desulfobacter sp. TaxID=240139 RepID=UPI0029C6A032|nr:hypothetical protein [uncultured Desulfobacter sp.]